MAHLHNLPKQKGNFLSSIGNKVKSVMEFGAAAKGLYDVGRGIYQGVSTYGPMVMSALETAAPYARAAAIL